MAPGRPEDQAAATSIVQLLQLKLLGFTCKTSDTPVLPEEFGVLVVLRVDRYDYLRKLIPNRIWLFAIESALRDIHLNHSTNMGHEMLTVSNVLSVDDDPIMRQVITAFFAKHGIANVRTAADGDEAIALFDRYNDFDLIISDLHMPGANGIEFIEHLSERATRVPLVVISSASQGLVLSASVLATAHNLNVLGTLPKPIDFKALEQLLGISVPAPV